MEKRLPEFSSIAAKDVRLPTAIIPTMKIAIRPAEVDSSCRTRNNAIRRHRVPGCCENDRTDTCSQPQLLATVPFQFIVPKELVTREDKGGASRTAPMPSAHWLVLGVKRKARAAIRKNRLKPPMIAHIPREIFVSDLRIGLRMTVPFESLGPVSSGAWITTSSALVGIVISFLHLGHGPFFPANLSLTVKRERQPGHVTGIGIGESSPNRLSGIRRRIL